MLHKVLLDPASASRGVHLSTPAAATLRPVHVADGGVEPIEQVAYLVDRNVEHVVVHGPDLVERVLYSLSVGLSVIVDR